MEKKADSSAADADANKDAKKEGEGAGNDDGKKADGEMNEGGEGGDAMAKMEGDAMAKMEGGMDGMESPHKYDKDARKYEGWAQIPAMILKQMIVNSYFGELVKADALFWEFNHKKGDVKKQAYTGACGLVGTAVNKAAADGQTVWLSGHIGEEDWLSLDGLAGEKGDKKIHFPFLTFGWATKDEATAALACDTP